MRVVSNWSAAVSFTLLLRGVEISNSLKMNVELLERRTALAALEKTKRTVERCV